jgi:DNA-binding NtrC family response regulator
MEYLKLLNPKALSRKMGRLIMRQKVSLVETGFHFFPKNFHHCLPKGGRGILHNTHSKDFGAYDSSRDIGQEMAGFLHNFPCLMAGNHTAMAELGAPTTSRPQAESSAMRSLQRVIREIGPTQIPVLLMGESGSGKEFLARQIHELSPQRREPFHKIACAGVSPEAFNGNGNGKTTGSRAKLPHAGTLFFDELCELEAACQPRMLLFLTDAVMTAPEKPRILSATTRNLEEEMRVGRFREELFFRLNGVCLRLPPLRQRREDIPALAERFLMVFAAEFARPAPALSGRAWRRLQDYSWPGNVRELQNVMRSVVVLGDEGLAMASLESAGAPATVSLKEASRAASREAERQLILKTLQETRWNRKRAAQQLKISYKALLYQLKQIGVEDSVTA